MKYLILILIYSSHLFSQTSPTPTESKPLPSTPNDPPITLNNTVSNKDKEPKVNEVLNSGDLDKEFYSYYFYTIPENEKSEGKSVEVKRLEDNLVKIFKDEIRKRDSSNEAREALALITANSIRYKGIDSENLWLQNLYKTLQADFPHIGSLTLTDNMYIVKFRKYMCLIIFQVDPKKHRNSPYLVELIFRKNAMSAHGE